jgi:hypothetical protein
MKIELPTPAGGRIDIGCFKEPFRGHDDQCVALIETKGLTQGLDYATNQAHGYASSFPTCNVVLTTNGYCYKAFQRLRDTFSAAPSAYLNINRPRKRIRSIQNTSAVLSMFLSYFSRQPNTSAVG